MQVVADVLNMPIKIARSEQACALGAAMAAATAAGLYPTIEKAQKAIGNGFEKIYYPEIENAQKYEMIKGDYEEKTGLQIIRTFESRSYKKVEMVLVARHGPFTWGAAAEKAVYNSVMLEKIAKMAYVSLQINSNTSKLNKTLIDKHYERKHGRDAYYR